MLGAAVGWGPSKGLRTRCIGGSKADVRRHALVQAEAGTYIRFAP